MHRRDLPRDLHRARDRLRPRVQGPRHDGRRVRPLRPRLRGGRELRGRRLHRERLRRGSSISRARPSTRALAAALVAGDLDGDLRVDLVGGWNTTVTVERGLGRGRFEVAQTIELPGAWVGALVLARLDGDALLDLAVADRRGWVHVAKGNAGGTFDAFTHLMAGVGADGIAAADLDDDGDLDLAVSAEGSFGQGSAAVLWNDGGGVFSTPQLLPSLPRAGRPTWRRGT